MSRLTAGAVLALVFASVAPAAGPQTQFINEQIAAGWKAAEIKKTAGRATDAEFLRRAFIDLIGRIPTVEECLDFEADKGTDKRARLVKRLLYDTKYQPKVNGQRVRVPGGGKDEYLTFDYADEYAEHWSRMWSIWLLSRTGDPRYREQMRLWLHKAFLENMPHKEMVTKLLTATGKSNANGAVNFIAQHLGDPTPDDPGTPDDERTKYGRFDAVPITSRVTRLFIGLQTQCTQCHDHPFNKEWVQRDFWDVNAFFRQVDRKGDPTRPVPGNRKEMALNVLELADTGDRNTDGLVPYEPRNGTKLMASPRFLKDLAQAEKGEESKKDYLPSGSKSRRQALAEFVVGHDNFGRAFVNRVWGHLFGRGLNKEPSVDDFGSHNEVVHPELLNGLAEQLAKYDYNPKLLLEWICTSDVYNLSHVAAKESADPKFDPYFARMPLKALAPEVLFESLMTATRADTRKGDAQKLQEQRDRWMARLAQNFGDDEGNELSFNGTIVQALLMMNGRELNDEVTGRGATVVRQVAEKYAAGGVTNPAKVLDELFLMTLSRRPTADERAKLTGILTRGAVLPGETPRPAPAAPPAAKTGPAAKAGKAAPPQAKKPGKSVAGPGGVILPTGPNDLTFYQDVFWALLNTNEFMLNH
ncbi:MAG: DUF1549 domain-containing protein [Gemmataceae bacterium]